MKEKRRRGKRFYIISVLVFVVIASSSFVAIRFLGVDITSVKELLFKEQEYNLVLDDFVVNIDSQEEVQRYVKAQITIAYMDKNAEKTLVEKTSLIRDLIIGNLMNCTADQLLDTGSLEELKSSLRGEINEALEEEVVDKVYFTDFLIQ